MGSSAKIISQGVNQLITGFPNWRLPTRVRLVADIVAGAAVARASDTTDGLTVTVGTSGVYDIGYPPGKRLSDVNPQAWANTPSTPALRNSVVVDSAIANTDPTVGKLRVVTGRESDGTIGNLNNGDVLDVSFSVDYG